MESLIYENNNNDESSNFRKELNIQKEKEPTNTKTKNNNNKKQRKLYLTKKLLAKCSLEELKENKKKIGEEILSNQTEIIAIMDKKNALNNKVRNLKSQLKAMEDVEKKLIEAMREKEALDNQDDQFGVTKRNNNNKRETVSLKWKTVKSRI